MTSHHATTDEPDGLPAAAHPVLIVEDEAGTREAFASLLELWGYPVATAANGEEALQLLNGGLEPCVILLDLVMPEKNGAQFRRAQLDDPRLAAIPVIVSSGRHDAKARAAQLGAVACVQKPVNFREVLRLLERYRPQS